MSENDRGILIELRTTLGLFRQEFLDFREMQRKDMASLWIAKAETKELNEIKAWMSSELAGIVDGPADDMKGMSKGAKESIDKLNGRSDKLERWVWMVSGGFALLQLELGILAVLKGWLK